MLSSAHAEGEPVGEAGLSAALEATAGCRPESVALVGNGAAITYRQLQVWVAHAGRALAAQGIGSKDRVAIVLPDALGMAVAFLGVASHAAAAPLNPAFTQEEFAFYLGDLNARALVVKRGEASPAREAAQERGIPVLELAPAVELDEWRAELLGGRTCGPDFVNRTGAADDVALVLHTSGTTSKPKLVPLTQTALRDRLPEAGLELVFLDGAFPAVASAQAVPIAVTPQNLAYVIYTSGSTGRPKGVEVRHSSLVNLLCDTRIRLGLNGDEAFLAVASACFDISLSELLLPLVTGARVVVCPDVVRHDGQELMAELQRQRITALQATPATWRLLLAAGWSGDARRLAICTGEALPGELASALLPRCRLLWNLYGPTETTIWSTGAVMRPGESVSIGRPLANTRIHILDAQGQSAPVGVPGELFIAGDGLARGYRNQPDLTAERFVAPLSGLDGNGRLYRTGDRCRWRASGDIEFLGRLDHQIKLRGFRVEPGEIEAELRRCPGVREAAVVAREDQPGDVRLTAYVVMRADSDGEAGRLRASLAQRLPDYMVPAAFVTLSALPLTPNGKLNRQALPAPDAGRVTLATSGTQPETLLEQRLTDLWKRCLGTGGVSPDDDFFDLGGHSLLAVRLITDISQLAGQPVPIASLFHAPTPRGMARFLAEGCQLPPWTSLVPLQPHGDKPPVFFVHGLGGAVSVFLGLARRLPPDQPAYGLHAVDHGGRIAHRETIEEMAAHYVREIISFQPAGPYLLAGYSAGGLIAYEIARQLHGTGRKVAMVGLLDTYPMACRMPWLLFARAGAPHLVGQWLRRWRAGTWPALLAYLARRLRTHWRAWRSLPAGDRHLYFRGRYAALKHWLLGSRLPGSPAAQEGNPAPPTAVETDPLLRASMEYRLREHSGPVVFFASENSPRSCLPIWRSFAKGGMEVRRVRGEHSHILDDSHLDSLTESFTASLRRANGEGQCASDART